MIVRHANGHEDVLWGMTLWFWLIVLVGGTLIAGVLVALWTKHDRQRRAQVVARRQAHVRQQAQSTSGSPSATTTHPPRSTHD